MSSEAKGEVPVERSSAMALGELLKESKYLKDRPF
jgi:hypothetical protein